VAGGEHDYHAAVTIEVAGAAEGRGGVVRHGQGLDIDAAPQPAVIAQIPGICLRELLGGGIDVPGVRHIPQPADVVHVHVRENDGVQLPGTYAQPGQPALQRLVLRQHGLAGKPHPEAHGGEGVPDALFAPAGIHQYFLPPDSTRKHFTGTLMRPLLFWKSPVKARPVLRLALSGTAGDTSVLPVLKTWILVMIQPSFRK
jgi:hypothetical protein